MRGPILAPPLPYLAKGFSFFQIIPGALLRLGNQKEQDLTFRGSLPTRKADSLQGSYAFPTNGNATEGGNAHNLILQKGDSWLNRPFAKGAEIPNAQK